MRVVVIVVVGRLQNYIFPRPLVIDSLLNTDDPQLAELSICDTFDPTRSPRASRSHRESHNSSSHLPQRQSCGTEIEHTVDEIVDFLQFWSNFKQRNREIVIIMESALWCTTETLPSINSSVPAGEIMDCPSCRSSVSTQQRHKHHKSGFSIFFETIDTIHVLVL